MQLDELIRRQNKRKDARKGFIALKSPDIALDQKDYEKTRKELRTVYFNECHGVDADLDLLKMGIRVAAEIILESRGAKRDKEGFLNNSRVMDVENEIVEQAKTQLDPKTRKELEREDQRTNDELEKQMREEKKRTDAEIEEEARKAQVPIAFPAVVDGAGTELSVVDVAAVEVTPESHRLVDHEARARNTAQEVAITDDAPPPAEPELKTEVLPPADGFKPEDKEDEAQPKKPKFRGKPAAKKPAKGGKKK